MSLMLIFSCQEENVQEVVSESSTTSFNIPDSLAVYEIVNGERRRSTSVRLLTNAEMEELIDKGLLGGDDEVDLRAQFCEWKDTGATLECDAGAVDCGPAFVNGDLCLVCYGPASTILNHGECR